MANTNPTTIDDYIADFPPDTQEMLLQMRAIIQQAAPEAEEMISYGIPTFRLHGYYLIYFAGHSKHIGLYPVPREHEDFKEALSAYKGGKGTAQFPLNKPLPRELITSIVAFRAGENLKRAAAKKKTK